MATPGRGEEIPEEYVKDIGNEERVKYKPFLFIYYIDENTSLEEPIPLFGEEFVEKNKDNAFLEINLIELELIPQYFFPERGLQSVKLVLKNDNIDCSHMFDTGEDNQSYLKDISSLRFFNAEKCKDLSHFFHHCNKIEDYSAIENWDVSNCQDFSEMFSSSSLKNTNCLSNWDVRRGEDFSKMFYNCKKLKNIGGIKKWDVRSGKYFNSMFEKCSKLKEINDLKFWRMTNAKSINYMFCNCSNLVFAESNYKWGLNKDCEKYGIFEECKKIKNIPENLIDSSTCKIF